VDGLKEFVFLLNLPDSASWYLLVPGILFFVLLPLLTWFFFCRCCGSLFRWQGGVLYLFLSTGVRMWEIVYSLQGIPGLLAEILLLTGCGCVLLRKKRLESVAVSVLILSVLNVSNGLVSWIGYRLLLPLVLKYQVWIRPSDTARECLRLLLVCALSAYILHSFRQCIADTNRQTLLQLTIPVFFISLVVRIIQTSIYGDNILLNSETGEILAAQNVNHGEFLLLQLSACVCLLVLLYAYRKILHILQAEQKVLLLEQQAAEQKIYLQEAVLRDQKTRAFRHDIRNHLTVLAELLKTGQSGPAYEYLSNLEEAAAELSFAVQTGNAAVDALLGSKFQAAQQKAVRIRCELEIPRQNAVRDMDWCILLSNALDNAVRACEKLPEEERQIQISSRKKGNFYLITIENSCEKELKTVPEDGIGLSNIRAVAERYHGAVENTVCKGVYRLQIFFGSQCPF